MPRAERNGYLKVGSAQRPLNVVWWAATVLADMRCNDLEQRCHDIVSGAL
jgi:hypothetical protein